MLTAITKHLTARLAVVSIAAAGALMASSPAQAEFVGGGVAHSFSGCTAYGWADDDVDPIRAIYGPSEVYGTPSTISVFDPYGGAFHLWVNAALDPGATRYRGRGSGIHRSQWYWEQRPRVRVNWRNVVLPRNESFANADAIDMRMNVNHFAGLFGCRATIDLTLYRNTPEG